MLAVGPYLKGARYQRVGNGYEDGNLILKTNGDYWGMLTAARVETLVWFSLACGALYFFAVEWASPGVAVMAVLLFTMLPSVLTHAGVATNDMAATACLMLSFYWCARYWRGPGVGNAAGLGLCMGLCLVSKLSLLLYAPICLGPFVLSLFFGEDRWKRLMVRRSLVHTVTGLGCCVLLVWAVYRFDVRPSVQYPHLSLPFLDLYLGVRELMAHVREGHPAIFMGQYRTHGSVWFFPVMLLFKTPVGILLLAGVGYLAMVLQWRKSAWPLWLAYWVPPVILAACLPSTINIGLRHVLPLYPFLALAAAGGLTMVSRRVPVGGTRPLLLMVFVGALAESASAVADPLPWFNLLAPEPTDRITVDSDHDWGQNLHRLSQYLKEAKIERLSLMYVGSAALGLFEMPKEVYGVAPEKPVAGYVAISSYARRLDCARNGQYCWLEGYQPEYSIGQSIHIYYLPMGLAAERSRAPTGFMK